MGYVAVFVSGSTWCQMENADPTRERVLLSHGGGGVAMRRLVEEIIVARLGNPTLNALGDSAVLDAPGRRIAFTTDSFIVKPIFFRGGDIGSLAVYGTVNDLSVQGARPLWLSLSLVIEEGFAIGDLERVLDSVKQAADRSKVSVVTGDTKVVERGAGDGIYINTSGIGEMIAGAELSFSRIRPGDKVLINGPIGDHGIAVVSQREGLEFETPVESDAAPLCDLTRAILEAGDSVRCMRDPTRGGVAAVVNEMASASKCGILLHEDCIPVREAVRSACDMLGFDPLSVANEGKVVVVCAADAADGILDRMKREDSGAGSAVIGEVVEEHPGKVSLATSAGGRRVVQVPYGEQLPRIC